MHNTHTHSDVFCLVLGFVRGLKFTCIISVWCLDAFTLGSSFIFTENDQKSVCTGKRSTRCCNSSMWSLLMLFICHGNLVFTALFYRNWLVLSLTSLLWFECDRHSKIFTIKPSSMFLEWWNNIFRCAFRKAVNERQIMIFRLHGTYSRTCTHAYWYIYTHRYYSECIHRMCFE